MNIDWLKNIIICLLVSCFLLVICSDKGLLVKNNFKKVSSFSRSSKIAICAFDSDFNQLYNTIHFKELSNENSFYEVFRARFKSRDPSRISLAIVPNQSFFFATISWNTDIYKISTDTGGIIEQYSVSDFFQKSPSSHNKLMLDLINVNSNKLWFVAESKKAIVIEWDFHKKPNTSIKTDYSVESYKSGIVYRVDRKPEYKHGRCYDWTYISQYGPMLFPKRVPVEYRYVDYSNEYGWLFSRTQKSNYIPTRNMCVVNKDEIIKYLVPGCYATWGKEGCLYYLKEDGSLWRCNKEGKKEELIYIPKKIFVKDNNLYPPSFNADKTMLMYPYHINEMDYNILVIDFVNKEYCVLENIHAYDFKWLNNPLRRTIKTKNISDDCQQ